jgi:hypothetical protein
MKHNTKPSITRAACTNESADAPTALAGARRQQARAAPAFASIAHVRRFISAFYGHLVSLAEMARITSPCKLTWVSLRMRRTSFASGASGGTAAAPVPPRGLLALLCLRCPLNTRHGGHLPRPPWPTHGRCMPSARMRELIRKLLARALPGNVHRHALAVTALAHMIWHSWSKIEGMRAGGAVRGHHRRVSKYTIRRSQHKHDAVGAGI